MGINASQSLLLSACLFPSHYCTSVLCQYLILTRLTEQSINSFSTAELNVGSIAIAIGLMAKHMPAL